MLFYVSVLSPLTAILQLIIKLMNKIYCVINFSLRIYAIILLLNSLVLILCLYIHIVFLVCYFYCTFTFVLKDAYHPLLFALILPPPQISDYVKSYFPWLWDTVISDAIFFLFFGSQAWSVSFYFCLQAWIGEG